MHGNSVSLYVTAGLSPSAVQAVASLPQPGLVSSVTAPPPPLTVVTLATRTVLDSKTHQSQVVLVSCLVHRQFRLDAAAPAPLFQQHFCGEWGRTAEETLGQWRI